MSTHASLPRLSAALLLGAFAATSAAQGTVQNYGAGTPGTGGFVPDYWVDSGPFLGNAGFHYTVDDCLGSALAIGVVGFGAASIPTFGIEFLIDPAVLVTMPFQVTSGSGAGNGSAAFSLPLPSQSGFLGLPLRSQVLILDSGSPGGSLAASRGVRITLGLPGLVLANTSVAGNTDPQYAIDVLTGTVVDFSSGAVDNSARHEFSNNGAIAFVGQGLGTTNVQAFDASTSTPSALATANLTGPGFPWVLRTHPDGQRLYVIPNSPLGTVPIAEVFDADPASPGFMQPHPLGHLPMTDILDSIGFEFDADGDFGFAATLGLISPGGSEVIKFDLRPSSPTFHQIVARVSFSTLIWAMTVTPDGDKVIVHRASFGASTGEIAIIDTATMQVEDADSITPGTQLIGGEISSPRTPISSDVVAMTVGPRGRALYLGGVSRVDRLVLDASDPSAYLTLTSSSVGGPSDFVWGVDANDVGDRIYVTAGSSIEERHAESLTVLRTFPTSHGAVGVIVR